MGATSKVRRPNRVSVSGNTSEGFSERYTLTNCLVSLGSYSTMYPATALAATVSGEAKYICPGPLRPGKLRFCALITICSGRVDTPGPALIHAPHDGSITVAPARWKMSRYPLRTQYSRVSCEPNWM